MLLMKGQHEIYKIHTKYFVSFQDSTECIITDDETFIDIVLFGLYRVWVNRYL